MIKAIIFDCFGVLTVDRWREFLDNLPQDNQEAIALAKELNHQYDAGLISLEEFTQGVEEATGVGPDMFGPDVEVGDNKNHKLLTYIKELKTDYKIGLLSNVATDWVREKLLTSEEQQLFDVMVFSFEAGMTKPDERIYKLALTKLGVEPHEAVFTDDIDRYVEAAKELGIKGVLYTDFTQFKHDLQSVVTKE